MAGLGKKKARSRRELRGHWEEREEAKSLTMMKAYRGYFAGDERRGGGTRGKETSVEG